MQTKYTFKFFLIISIILMLFSFCKKDNFSLSVKKVQLTDAVFEKAVLKVTAEDEYTLMCYNNNQKLIIVKYNMLTDQIDSKTIDVPQQFGLSNFVVIPDGYIISSEMLISKIGNNDAIEWVKEPTLPLIKFGSSLISDNEQGVWLNGVLTQETDYDPIYPPCLLSISDDGTISVLNKYVINFDYSGGRLGCSISGIYKSSDSESLILSLYRGYFWGYSYEIMNVRKDGSVIWRNQDGGNFVLALNNSYFVMARLWVEGPDMPRTTEINIIDRTGNTIKSKSYEEAPYSDSYTGLKYLLDYDDLVVVLVTYDDDNYQLNFYNDQGILVKSSSLAGFIAINSVQGFYATDTDFVFLIVEESGIWLYSIPKNQF